MRFEFPTHIRTKADAVALLDKLFPKKADDALVELLRERPDITHPRYQVDIDMADRMTQFMYWLFEKRPKIYKRVRTTLIAGANQRYTALLKDNAMEQSFDRDYAGRLEFRVNMIKKYTLCRTSSSNTIGAIPPAGSLTIGFPAEPSGAVAMPKPSAGLLSGPTPTLELSALRKENDQP